MLRLLRQWAKLCRVVCIGLWRIFWRSAMLQWRIIIAQPLEQMLLIWMPAAAIGLVWYTFSTAQVHDLPIGVFNQDHSALSRQLERLVNASPSVEISQHYHNKKDAMLALETTEVYAVLLIPKQFSKKIKQLKTSPVVLNVNAQYGTHSGIVQSGVSNAVRTFSAGIEIAIRKKIGMSEEQAIAAIMPVKVQAKMAFNLSLSYQRFLACAVIPALLHILATVVGVGSIGRELRHKTLGRWFHGVCGAEGKSLPQFFAMLSALIGKLFWPMVAFSLWSTITLMLISQESPTAFSSFCITALNAWLMILVSLWLGVILTTISLSKRLGLSSAGIITAPAFAYSGITYPIAAMPAGAQVVASFLPLTHYLKLQIAQMLTKTNWQMALPTTYQFLLAVMIMALLATALTLLATKQRHRWGKR